MLAGLRERLMAPEVAAEAMRAYAEETNRLNWERRASAEANRRELEKVQCAIQEIVAMVEDGHGSRSLVQRLRDLEAREDDLRNRLNQPDADTPYPSAEGRLAVGCRGSEAALLKSSLRAQLAAQHEPSDGIDRSGASSSLE